MARVRPGSGMPGRWTPPPARVMGDRLLKAKQAEQRIRDAEAKAKAEIAQQAEAEKADLREEVEGLEERFDRLVDDLPKMMPASGGGKRTIKKVLERDFDIDTGFSGEVVKHTAQTLTSGQQAQARTNIGGAADADVIKHVSQSLTESQKEQARANIGATTYALTKTAMKALPARSGAVVQLVEDGLVGTFRCVLASDYASLVSADTTEILIAASTANASYAWLRTTGYAVSGIDARWAGLVTNDTSKGAVNAAAFIALFALASSLKAEVRLPGGTITCNFGTTAAIVGYSASPCVAKLSSNLVVRGVGMDMTTLKLADGQSSTTSYNWNFFTGNTVLQNVQFYDMTFDINGSNNLISPNRSVFDESAQLILGTPGVVRFSSAHGLSVGDDIRIHYATQTQTLSTGVTAGTTYYVQAVVNTTDINISATNGGAAIDFTGSAANPVTVEKIGSFASVNAAAIFISGTVVSTGDARLEGGMFQRVKVINSPGWSCMVFGAGSTVSATRGKDIEVASCVFYNNGLDADDHSSIFILANHCRVHDCIFDHPSQSKGIFGPAVACEIHGSNNKFYNNTVNRYMQALWLTGSAVGEVRDQQVYGNTIKVNGWAIATWTIDPEDNGLYGIGIGQNFIEINNGVVWDQGGATGYGAGIVIINTSGGLGRVNAAHNIINALGSQRTNHGIVFASGGSSPALISYVDALDNTLYGFGSGIIVTNSGRPVWVFNARGNNVASITPNVSFTSTLTRGISVNGTHYSISIEDNTCEGSSGNLMWGVRLDGTYDHLTMSGNSAPSASEEISDACTVTGRRKGEQALAYRFTTAPAQGTWDIGDFVPKKRGTITLDGVAPNRTLKLGWHRMVAGSASGASTEGTHWAVKTEQLGV